MGLFTKDKKEKPKTPKKVIPEKAEVKVAKATKDVSSLDLTKILKNPRITEKAAHMSEGNVYTFDVAVRSTKPEIKKAIKALYGVNVRKINISAIPKKAVFRKGGKGMKGGGKKAYVFLERGQTIEFA
ncbi:MAG: large subunit ribosomal protein L23 [Candidatus Paceibacteria bacterium]|jgi:large subunit ribosomal protein L23